MTDPRIDRLAELLAGYSLDLRAGQVVRFDAHEVASPLLVALVRSALRRGALPYTNVALEGFAELLLERASDAQLTYLSPVQWQEVETVDAFVTVWAEANTRAFTGVDPKRLSTYLAAQRQLSNRRWERIAAGQATWVGTLFPTDAHAQDADMSLEEYERFVFGACHLDEQDPAAYWRSTAAELESRARQLASVRELRVVGLDTELTLDVGGRSWLAAAGKHNMPDGEVFTSPLESATHGEIRFTFPAVFQGREVADVRLRFEGGRVVSCEAASGGDYLEALLEMDDGARVLGEVAFGLNDEIDRFTRNILFDEKIGGTMHFALGSSFAQAGGQNRSGLHWDMICDLRAEGEVYADGELIWRAGKFLAGAREGLA